MPLSWFAARCVELAAKKLTTIRLLDLGIWNGDRSGVLERRPFFGGEHYRRCILRRTTIMRLFAKRRLVPTGLSLLLCIVITGCAQNPQAAKETDQGNDQPGLLSRTFGSNRPITVPEGTDLTVLLDQSLSSMENHPGDMFQASVAVPIVIDGKTVIPKDARVKGHVVDAQASGRLSGTARLVLTLDRRGRRRIIRYRHQRRGPPWEKSQQAQRHPDRRWRRSRRLDRRNRRRRQGRCDWQCGRRWRGNRRRSVLREEGHPRAGGDKADLSTGSVGHDFRKELIHPTVRAAPLPDPLRGPV